jgi:penicillin-binding protein 1A
LTKSKFSQPPPSVSNQLNCDLYELDDTLWAQIEKSVHQRDSVLLADSTAMPPPETFLQTLYKRKQRFILASESAKLD